jgi:Holliday junction resolvase-like predicted endonuclease
MNPELLARAVSAIVPEATLAKFQETAGIASRSVAKDVLGFLLSNGIGSISKQAVAFGDSDRLKVAALALHMGCDVEQVSKQLSWQDFEKLASQVLMSFGYKTQTNVRFTKPRMEIDVVGVNSGFAIVVDCKHWKRNNLSSISSYSRKQAARAGLLIQRDKKISQAVPVILTLHAESVRFVNGIPIVPILRFRSFVMDVKGFLPEIYVIAG